MVRNIVPWLALAIGSTAAPAFAHHSFSMFDAAKDVVIEGTVKSYAWTNPHVWIDVDVAKAGGGTETWGLESQSVGILFRQGWKADSVKPGDKIKVEIHPLKDGTPGGQVMRVMLPDGSELLTNMARRGN